MACINGDGTLTVVAEQMLGALETVDQIDQVAALTGLPMYRVRSGLREMVDSGLVERTPDRYTLSARGRQIIDARRGSR